MNTKKKIVMIGDIGGDNDYHVGDEAVCTANISLLKQHFNNIELVVCSRSPGITSRTHALKAIDSLENFFLKKNKIWKLFTLILFSIFSPKRISFLNELKQADLLFACGGAHFNSMWGRMLQLRALQFFLAKMYGKKIFISGQTIGPLSNIVDKYTAKFCLNSASVIMVRDQHFSKKVLNEINVDKPEVICEIDDAFLLPAKTIYPYSIDRSGNSILIGVSICSRHRQNEDDFSRSITGVLDFLINKYDCTIVCIPHQRLSGRKDDITVSQHITERLQYPHKAIIKKEPYSDREIKFITGQMDINLGTRYHAIVFSASMTVPFLALSYDDYTCSKHTGFLEFLNLEKYHFSLTGAYSVQELENTLSNIIENRLEIKKEIAEKIKNFDASQSKKILSLHTILGT